MRILSVICCVLVQIGCAGDTETSQSDCRTLSGACNSEFMCALSPSRQYECLPRMDGEVDAGSNSTMNDTPDNEMPSVQTDSDIIEPDNSPGTGPDEPQADSESEDPPMQESEMNEPADEGSQSVPPAALGDVSDCSQIAIVGPVLPAEAGHRAATVLTPTTYPYEVGSIRYELLTPQDTPACTSTLAHTTELMVIANSAGLPPTPGEQMLRFRSYNVPASMGTDDGRAVEITLPTPLYIAEDEQLVVSIELAASQERHLCLSRCLDHDAAPGTDWWSNAAQPPYDWSDLIVDYGFKGALRVQAFPVQVDSN